MTRDRVILLQNTLRLKHTKKVLKHSHYKLFKTLESSHYGIARQLCNIMYQIVTHRFSVFINFWHIHYDTPNVSQLRRMP